MSEFDYLDEFQPFVKNVGKGEDFHDSLKKSLAILSFTSKQVSLGKAAELAGMTLNDFIHLLTQNNIPSVEYTMEHLEQDLEGVKEVIRKKKGEKNE